MNWRLGMPKYENSDPVSHSNYHDHSSHSTMQLDEESQEPVLPKHLFRNRFTWSCYEICNHRLPLEISGLCFIISWVIWKLNIIYIIYRGCLVGAMACGVFLGFALIIPFLWHSSKYRLRSTTELARQVLELNPGLDIDKWELVASTSNTIFYQKQIWRTPYFFFDGQHTQDTFTVNILKPYSEGKFNYTNRDELESSRLYLKSLKEIFESSLKDDLPVFVSELELPRDVKKSRFLSNPGYQAIISGTSPLIFFSLVWICSLIHQNSLQPRVLLYIVFWDFCGFAYMWFCCRRYLYPIMTLLQCIKLLAVVEKVKPAKNLDKWDDIARYMNQLLVDDGNRGPTKFFDGRHCLECYEIYFEPFQKRPSRMWESHRKN